MKAELISIEDAAAKGIERLRKPIWSNPLDHVRIDIRDGKAGIWLHLYAPSNLELNGRDPVSMLIMDYRERTSKEFVPYDGPLPDSQEYKAEQDVFSARLRDYQGI